MAESELLTLLISVVQLIVALVSIAGLWRIFQKAGEGGWKSIIPIYNIWVLIKVSGNSGVMFILLFIPILHLYPAFKVPIDLAKKFGRGIGFGLGMIFFGFIFFPLLGFGSYQYEG